jgi:foldase protein PrsA
MENEIQPKGDSAEDKKEEVTSHPEEAQHQSSHLDQSDEVEGNESSESKEETLLEDSSNTEKSSKSFTLFIVIVIIAAVILILAGVVYKYKGLVVAATVDGTRISRLEIIKSLEKQSGKSLLDTFINEKLINNEAKKRGIVITSEDIDAEIKTIEDQVAAQDMDLETALSQEGMTLEELKDQIVLQKELEKMIEDKVAVTDEEVNAFIESNGITIPEGGDESLNAQIKTQLQSQKFNTEAQTLIEELKSNAEIKYFVEY